MLRTVNSFLGYTVLATDGEIGKVRDLFFDDQTWGAAYLVVRLGGVVRKRDVLLSPTALGRPDWERKQFPVAVSKHDIEHSPETDVDKPISRQHEEELHKYFGWTPYWIPGDASMGLLPLARPVVPPVEIAEQIARPADGDPHLQSVKDVMGYGIEATDGRIGHVEDFVVEDTTWSIQYTIVDTANWLPGRKVLIAPEWIYDMNWAEEIVRIGFTVEMVRDSPLFDPSAAINETYERTLYDYYGRPSGKKETLSSRMAAHS